MTRANFTLLGAHPDVVKSMKLISSLALQTTEANIQHLVALEGTNIGNSLLPFWVVMGR
jgi:hypothetical protein